MESSRARSARIFSAPAFGGPALLASLASLLFAASGCAHETASSKTPAPQTAVVVAPAPTTASTPDAPDAPDAAAATPAKSAIPVTPEMKATADQAAVAAEAQMAATERECGAQWFGDGSCDATFFRSFAADYQAYYATQADPTRDQSRIDALARLGGKGVSIEEAATRLSLACEERCRTKRVASIHVATEEAARTCGKASRGYGVCEALGKKIAHTLPAREADLAENSCTGQCDDTRSERASIQRRNANRPRTKAQVAACKAECERTQGGGWCGTGLLACLADCSPDPTPLP